MVILKRETAIRFDSDLSKSIALSLVSVIEHKKIAAIGAEMTDQTELLATLTADIVSAHVANNAVSISDMPSMIENVHGALAKIISGEAQDKPEERKEPAVPIRSSIKPDFIVCLEDGKRLKMLRRHLMTHYNMTPDQYRKKWGLPSDYPMVAPNYAERRRELAKSIGLGTKANRAN